MSRWDDVVREVRRKSIHIIPGVMAIPVVVWGGKLVSVPIAAFFFALYLLHEVSLRMNLRFRVPIAYHTYTMMAREEEIKGKHFRGATYFWGITLLLVALLPPIHAAASVMVSAFGDAAAAIVGKAVGGPRLPLVPRKTVAGTTAMFLAGTASCLVVGLPVVIALLTAATSTIAEWLCKRSVDDELAVPAVAAVTITIAANALK